MRTAADDNRVRVESSLHYSAEAAMAMEIGTEHNRASETTMLTVALSLISMDSGN